MILPNEFSRIDLSWDRGKYQTMLIDFSCFANLSHVMNINNDEDLKYDDWLEEFVDSNESGLPYDANVIAEMSKHGS